jgi:hypothetical protein
MTDAHEAIRGRREPRAPTGTAERRSAPVAVGRAPGDCPEGSRPHACGLRRAGRRIAGVAIDALRRGRYPRSTPFSNCRHHGLVAATAAYSAASSDVWTWLPFGGSARRPAAARAPRHHRQSAFARPIARTMPCHSDCGCGSRQARALPTWGYTDAPAREPGARNWCPNGRHGRTHRRAAQCPSRCRRPHV